MEADQQKIELERGQNGSQILKKLSEIMNRKITLLENRVDISSKN